MCLARFVCKNKHFHHRNDIWSRWFQVVSPNVFDPSVWKRKSARVDRTVITLARVKVTDSTLQEVKTSLALNGAFCSNLGEYIWLWRIGTQFDTFVTHVFLFWDTRTHSILHTIWRHLMIHIVCICMYMFFWYTFVHISYANSSVLTQTLSLWGLQAGMDDVCRLLLLGFYLYSRCIESSHVTFLCPEVVPFPQSLGNGQELGHAVHER